MGAPVPQIAVSASQANVAPPVVLAATNEETLAVIPLAALKKHALDLQ